MYWGVKSQSVPLTINPNFHQNLNLQIDSHCGRHSLSLIILKRVYLISLNFTHRSLRLSSLTHSFSLNFQVLSSKTLKSLTRRLPLSSWDPQSHACLGTLGTTS